MQTTLLCDSSTIWTPCAGWSRRAWRGIAAACRHTAYNAVRDSSRHPWLPLDGGPEVPDERQEVEDRVFAPLELDALAQVWPRLDEEHTRWLLEARYILDYSDGELARELGVKPTASAWP